MNRRGLFVSLDGVDGAGKTTQLPRMADWLQAAGHDVLACRDPGGTEVGDAIRAILLDAKATIAPRAEMLLYMAARAQLVSQIIQPALAAGKTVLSDRFLLANVVYQGHARGLDVQALWDIGRQAVAGVIPDLSLVLDLPASAARARLDRPLDRMEQQGEAFRERVRQGYLLEAARDPDRIRIVDAAGSVEEVQSRLRGELGELLAATRP